MGYLQTRSETGIAAFSKATISLWFRIPAASVAAAAAHGASYRPPDLGNGGIGPEVFRYSIPLVVFGPSVNAKVYGTTVHHWTQSTPGGTIEAFTLDSTDQGGAPCEPSYIGVEANGGSLTLRMVFQLGTRAHVQGLRTEVTDLHWVQDPVSLLYNEYRVVKDISYVLTGVPEQFVITPGFDVSVDKWHHLLVSFDFSGSVTVAPMRGTAGSEEALLLNTISGFCKFWYAFDGHNKNGRANIGEACWVPHDLNGIVPVTSKSASFDSYTPVSDPFTSGELNDPIYSWSAPPLNVGLIALPASDAYLDTLYPVELAEFQLFMGISADTSNASLLHMFIADGKPVAPGGSDTKQLNRDPDIMFHGVGNWKQGRNTGAMDAIEFAHFGTINKFKPEPELGK